MRFDLRRELVMIKYWIVLLCVLPLLSGCVGMIIGTAVDATIEVAKVPFKAGKAVVDVVVGDDDEEEEK